MLCDEPYECVSRHSSSPVHYMRYEACDGMQLQADSVSDSYQDTQRNEVRVLKSNAKFAEH